MKVGKFATAVYKIVSDNPKSTAGEVFEVYKQLYPSTSRSRNEVAKRVSELKAKGLVTVAGQRACECSGKRSEVFVAKRIDGVDFSDEAPEEQVTPRETESFDSREAMADHITETYGEKCVAMDEEDRATLRKLRHAVNQLVGNPLFEVLVPDNMSADAGRLQKALRHF